MPTYTVVKWTDYEPERRAKIEAAGHSWETYETKVDDCYIRYGGRDTAAEVAKCENAHDGEWFRNGGDIYILEPAEIAGHYEITTEYEPRFWAHPK